MFPIRKASDNPILNTRMFEVEYVDGNNSALSANLVPENMFVQIDKERNHHVLMDEITDHQFDEEALNSQDAFVTTSSGTKCRRQTTQGVSLCINWRDVNTTWVTLKDLKEVYPVQLLEYAMATKIYIETAFSCWLPHTLEKRNSIIAKVKS